MASCRRFFLWSLLAGCLAVPAAAQTVFFPAERLFPKFLADGPAEQFSLVKDADTRRILGSIGGVQRLVQFTSASGTVFQVGAGATVYGSFIKAPHVLQVVTADFFVDIPLEIRFSPQFALRTGWGHHSAHLVDDGIEILNHHSINYAKDYIPAFAAYQFCRLPLTIYGGLRFDYYTIPEREGHYVVQAGAEGGDVRLSPWARLYGAIDIKLKSEAAWGTTQSYQLGVKLLEDGVHDLRVAYTFRTGLDDRGQFYTDKVTLSLVGVYFDL